MYELYVCLLLVLNAQNLKLLAVDLCRPDLLTTALAAVGVDFSLPTLLLSEVVLTYLPPARYAVMIWCLGHWSKINAL